MSVELAFLDTNVLVYCFDSSAPKKQQRARELVEDALRDGSAVISTQVVQEFLNLATRRFACSFTGDDLRAYFDSVLAPLCSVYPDAALFRLALEVRDETGYSFYDSLIVAGALRAVCTRLYSEDLQDGREIRGLRIENPFQDL
jgi:predicted nucleic acid-binding protein